MTPEHKEKMALAREAARLQRLADEQTKERTQRSGIDEIADLRRKLEEAERQQSAAGKAPLEDHSIGELPNKEPIEGYAEELRRSMKAYVDEQMRQMMPERGEPIRAREPAREGRDAVRRGAAVAHDREGNPVYRRRDGLSDPFAIPQDLQEPGWDRQWIRVSVYGQEDVDNQVGMQENGWRPISANRPGWEGRFMPPGYKGAIQKSGLMLMERPMALTVEANQEAAKVIRGQTETQRQQFGMALPHGFDGNTPAARAASGVKVGRAEATPSNLRPKHEIREALDID
jgi:hypothetical protein